MSETANQAQISARIVIAGTLECRGADGELLQTIDVRGAIPLHDLFADPKEAADGDRSQ